jgi:serine/threonine protein kinase
MPLHPNNDLLVAELTKLPLLDGRFENIRLVNYDPHSGVKRGCFSLVFCAHDRLTGKQVALKFFDLDPAWIHDSYRNHSFAREHTILETLVNAERCLQLKSDMKTYSLQVTSNLGPALTLPCRYFAVDWVEEEIDSFFLNPTAFEPYERLRLFNEIILAVEALHVREVFHRDIKADNLRARREAMKRVVIAIDLGTAARMDSGGISSAYGTPAGAPVYSAPEAQCGLAGNRLIAHRTDFYALGCLLFELFNNDYFYRSLNQRNANYQVIIHVLSSSAIAGEPDREQLQRWRENMVRFSRSIAQVPMDGPGSAVPPGIGPMLNEIVFSMTHFNLDKRPSSLSWVRSKIASAMRVLQHEKSYRHRLMLQRSVRQKRLNKIIAREARRNQASLANEKC